MDDPPATRPRRPVVVIGDSLTEAAPLPAAICGHAVVNAGIGGANASSTRDGLATLLAGVSPALIVLAIGTNDTAPAPDRPAMFRATYGEILARAEKLTPRIAIATIPSIDAAGPLTKAGGMDATLVDALNDELAGLASRHGAVMIDVRAAVDGAELAAPTIDGVHLSPRAYDYWTGEIQRGITAALGCGAVAGSGIPQDSQRGPLAR